MKFGSEEYKQKFNEIIDKIEANVPGAESLRSVHPNETVFIVSRTIKIRLGVKQANFSNFVEKFHIRIEPLSFMSDLKHRIFKESKSGEFNWPGINKAIKEMEGLLKEEQDLKDKRKKADEQLKNNYSKNKALAEELNTVAGKYYFQPTESASVRVGLNIRLSEEQARKLAELIKTFN